MHSNPTIAALAADLAAGRTTAAALLEDCLDRIADDAGEGSRTFLRVSAASARGAAEAMDKLRSAGAAPSAYAGIPISVKDLFDIAGEVTTAGSRALADAPPAQTVAPAIARLRQAGFVVVGRTNMTEFAYSGLGINPHYGTPLSPWDRASGRVPGGSSSGAAVSVADGMAHGAVGTDTGGSCRIPAAYCGIVGYKPTARRVPIAGAVPLATSLDSVGPLARSVGCCAIMDAVMADEPVEELPAIAVSGLRICVPQTMVLDGMDEHVGRAFEDALSSLSRAGARVERLHVPEFEEARQVNRKGGFAAAESYAWHRELIQAKRDVYDPRVLVRIIGGERQSAADYIDLIEARRALIARISRRLAPFDAVAMPTSPIVPPRIADLETDDEYSRSNLLSLRNPALINLIDGCSISLPMTGPGEPPAGLMLSALGGRDRALMAVAQSVEATLQSTLRR